MAGTCSETINVCVQNWQCEPGQTGYETDGCGNRRANPVCAAVIKYGSLSFTSIPHGAEIYLAYHGQTPQPQDPRVFTPANITDIPVGLYDYVLKLDGFKDYSRTIEVIEGSVSVPAADLIPNEGCIYFASNPQGAKIIVDNVDRGVAPALVCDLRLGSHTYRLELSGYRTVTGSVGIGAGQGVVVASVLTPVEKGIGAGTILGITILSIGALGAVVLAIRKRQPPTARQYLKYPLTPR